MNMCCLIKLHVDMLILFKRLLTTDVNAKGKNGKISLACENNNDGVILILCMVHNLLFTSFFVS